MKKLSSAIAVLLALSAGSAFGADLPSIKGPPPPPPPPPPMWTGFYVGLNAGGTWNSSNNVWTSVGPAFADVGWPHGLIIDTAPHLGAFSAAASSVLGASNGGFIGGGQIGYNWQFGGGSFVAGVEADIQGIAGSNNTRNGFGAAFVTTDPSNYIGATSISRKVDYLGTVRGRIGWLFTPTWLVYGTGGLAYGGVNLRNSVFVWNDVYSPTNHIPATFGGTSFSDTRVGWTAGGGLEWMFMPNWSAKVEYLYYDLGTVNSYFFLPQVDNASGLSAVSAGTTRARFDGHIVRAGLNWHWGAPPPVVARY